MMKKPEIYLRQNIKYLREAKELTQEEFAASIGNISQEAVCNWEAGRREPELSSLIMIAKFFDITLDDLVLREIAPPKSPVALYAANIKFLRKKHGITQEQMAELLKLKNITTLTKIVMIKLQFAEMLKLFDKLPKNFGRYVKC